MEKGEAKMRNPRFAIRICLLALTSGVLLVSLSCTKKVTNPKPSPPTLSSPSNGATGVALNPTLSWNSSGATSYSLEISTDISFSSAVDCPSGISGTSYSLSGLGPNTTYYWRVNASNQYGTSGWSNARSFTTVIF